MSLPRCSHFSPRLGHHLTKAILQEPMPAVVAKTEIQSILGGTTSLAALLHKEQPSSPIGIMVAGNSGRPGGACGNVGGKVRDISARHSTQEEDIVSS